MLQKFDLSVRLGILIIKKISVYGLMGMAAKVTKIN